MTPDPSSTWMIVRDGWDAEREARQAALFTQGNGYVASRGAWELPAPGRGTPGTFAAGIYADRPGEVRELVRMPEWTRFRVRFRPRDGEECWLGESEPASVRRSLNLRAGLLSTDAAFDLPGGGRIVLASRRFISLASEHRLAQTLRIAVDGAGGGSFEIEGGWEDPEPQNGFLHLDPTVSGHSEGDGWLSTQTRDGRYVVGCAARLVVEPDRADAAGAVVGEPSEGARRRVAFTLEKGRTATVRLFATIFTSRDEVEDPRAAALRELEAFVRCGQLDEFNRHARAWIRFWDDADVEIEGHPELERAVRFSACQLRSAANPSDPGVSIGAKGLCDGYRGHVFWDTEIFMLPFFTATAPEIARTLLTYRYVTLDDARRRAESEGLRGARFPWESTDRGLEACPERVGARIRPETVVRIFDGREQVHVVADVAFATASYFGQTGDESFMKAAGVEILLETARFWASRVQALEGRDLFAIKQVIGPDEGHQGVDNDVYTNVMARWNLLAAAGSAAWLARTDLSRWRELRARLRIDWEEIAEWRRIARGIIQQEPDESGLIEQFDGYFSMPDIPDYEAWLASTTPEQRRREWIPYGTSLLKQPDLVMLFVLFPEMYPRSVRERNLEFYEPRTTHRSSLGLAVHAIARFDLGSPERGLEFLERAAAVDLKDGMGNTALGIHTAAAGGVWLGLIRGMAGVRLSADGIELRPSIPDSVRALRFGLRFRGNRLRFEVRGDGVVIRREPGGPAPVRIRWRNRDLVLDDAHPEVVGS